jgi:hypothetical protein
MSASASAWHNGFNDGRVYSATFGGKCFFRAADCRADSSQSVKDRFPKLVGTMRRYYGSRGA